MFWCLKTIAKYKLVKISLEKYSERVSFTNLKAVLKINFIWLLICFIIFRVKSSLKLKIVIFRYGI